MQEALTQVIQRENMHAMIISHPTLTLQKEYIAFYKRLNKLGFNQMCKSEVTAQSQCIVQSLHCAKAM